MMILGIDPGTALTGYALLEFNPVKSKLDLLECSVIATPSDLEMHHRLDMLHSKLREVIQRYEPELMAIERLFFNTNVKTALSVGQARGVPLLLAAQHSMKVYEYTALEAKHVLTGYGRASKKEMQAAIRDYMQLDSIVKPDDANDAVAMALCFLDKDCNEFGKVLSA